MKSSRLFPRTTEGWIAAVLGLIFFGWFVFLSFTTIELYGGADEIVHFWMAKYSWKYPYLFLDLWGKPVFTMLASPLAQFGFEAGRLFNVVVASLTAFFSFRILQRVRGQAAWWIIPILVSSPVYFILVPSMLTELLFGLILIIFLYLYLRGNLHSAAIILSFLPFTRNEGLFLLPLVAVFFIVTRYYRGVGLLLTGILLISLGGWLVNGDILWLWHANPYKGTNSYGSGEFLHFVSITKHTTGLIPAVLASAAWVLMTIRIFIGGKKRDWSLITFLYMTSILFLAYLFMHSLVWYKGMGVSLGLIRVMAAVYPLVALAAAYFLGEAWVLVRNATVRILVMALVLLPALWYPIDLFRPPVKESPMQAPGRLAALFITENYPDSVPVTCLDPRIVFHLERDPFDERQMRRTIHNIGRPSSEMQSGGILIWETHFAGVERGISKQDLLADTSLTLIHQIDPDFPFMVFGDKPYQVLLFEKRGID